MKNLTIFLIALSVISCKARKVSLSKVDSNTTINKEHKVISSSSSIDTGKINTSSTTVQTDTGSYEVNIKTGGKIISIKNGNYSGPADEVTIKGNHQSSSSEHKQTEEIKGAASESKSELTSQEQSNTRVIKKDKQTATKPDYTWMVYSAGAIILILLFLFIYFKIKK